MVKLLCLIVLMFSTSGYAKTNYDIPLKYKNKICHSFQGRNNTNSYDVENCLKGTFGSTSDFNKSE